MVLSVTLPKVLETDEPDTRHERAVVIDELAPADDDHWETLDCLYN